MCYLHICLPGRNAYYMVRPLTTLPRFHEHLNSDTNGHILNILKNQHLSGCMCFSVIDSACTIFQLKLKEVMHGNPILNEHVKELINSNRDGIRTARKAFLISKGKTLEP